MRRYNNLGRIFAALSVSGLSSCSGAGDDTSSGQTGQAGGQGGAVTSLGGSTGSVAGASAVHVGGSSAVYAGSAGTTAMGGASSTAGTTAMGGAASCTDTAWNPPATANGNTGIPAGLDKEWERSGADILAATNIKTRQLMENGGKMRYCARWDSSSPISATERKQVAALMGACDQQWASQLSGWGCWPYSTIDVNIVMWVVRDASLLTGWTAAEGTYIVGKTSTDDSDVACPSNCLQEPGMTQKTSCTGGAVYDEYLWLDGDKTDYTGWGFSGGFYMSASYFMTAAKANATTETIVAHELGHAHGLNDFYTDDVVPAGWKNFVMMAGSSNVVTTTDGWMLRNVWRHIRSDYGYPAGQ